MRDYRQTVLTMIQHTPAPDSALETGTWEDTNTNACARPSQWST